MDEVRSASTTINTSSSISSSSGTKDDGTGPSSSSSSSSSSTRTVTCEVYAAFAATREKGGNEAAVVHVHSPLSASVCQRIAAGLGYGDTVFASDVTPDPPSPSMALKFFSPTAEVALCGHATIAAVGWLPHAHALPPSLLSVGLSTSVGPLTATAKYDMKARMWRTAMTQAIPSFRGPVSPDVHTRVCDALVVDPASVPVTCVASTGLDVALVQFSTVSALRSLSPNMSALADVTTAMDVSGVLAFNRLPGLTVNRVYVRFFAPKLGVAEENATGTANTALACHLVQSDPSLHTAASRPTGVEFKIDQGVFMGKGRVAQLTATVRLNDDGSFAAPEIAGNVRYLGTATVSVDEGDESKPVTVTRDFLTQEEMDSEESKKEEAAAREKAAARSSCEPPRESRPRPTVRRAPVAEEVFGVEETKSGF